MPDEPNVAVLQSRFDDLEKRFDRFEADTKNGFQGVNNHLERRFSEVIHEMEKQSFVPYSIFNIRLESVTIRLSDIEKAILEEAKEKKKQRDFTRNAIITSLLYPTLVAIIVIGFQLAIR